MHAPTTTSLRPSAERIRRFTSAAGRTRQFPLGHGYRRQVDNVADPPVHDEEGEVRPYPLGVHDHRGIQARILGRQLQRGALGPGPLRLVAERHGQRERHLHPPVPGGVPCTGGRSGHAHRSPPAARTPGCSSPRRVPPPRPARGRRRAGACKVTPNVPSAIAVSSPCEPILPAAGRRPRRAPAGPAGHEPVRLGPERLAQHAPAAGRTYRTFSRARSRSDRNGVWMPLGHHPDEQDGLIGHHPAQVEERVQQVSGEDVAGHVLGRRHVLSRAFGNSIPRSAGQSQLEQDESARPGRTRTQAPRPS